MAGLCAPLSTLHQYPHGYWRMTRGRCGSLLLHRDGLAPSTPCRAPGALRFTRPHRRHVARVVVGYRGGKILAAADQEIQDMVSQGLVLGMTGQMDAPAILRQRIFTDLGQHRPGPIRNTKD